MAHTSKNQKPAVQGGPFAKQNKLFEPPPVSPFFPNGKTKKGRLIAALLPGERLSHPEFGVIARTWRLAAYAQTLKRNGWHVRTLTEGGQPWTGKTHGIARYSPEAADIKAVRGVRT